MKRVLRKILVMSILSMVLTTSVFVFSSKAEAASKYITVEEFAKALAKELNLKPITGEHNGYVNVLLDKGIIKKGDVSSYTSNLTRTDATVFLSRADEFLYGDTLDPELVDLVIEKRISDIKKIKASKREDVAKGYLKGFMKGYNNGDYSTNRELRGSKAITRAGALNIVNFVKDKSLRAPISPDGQLIRTTKLPKNADMFPYILASYPNDYYEWKLRYEVVTVTGRDGEVVELESLKDYASPADIDQLNLENYNNLSLAKEEHLDKWVEKAKNHLELVFSADYRTIDEEWEDALLSTSYAYETAYEWLPKRQISEYVAKMKKSKSVVEYDKIAVDGSSIYYCRGTFYLRAYVKYRVLSTNVPSTVSDDVFIFERPYNNILFSNKIVNIEGFELGKWSEMYFDVELTEATRSINDLGVVSGTYLPGKRF